MVEEYSVEGNVIVKSGEEFVAPDEKAKEMEAKSGGTTSEDRFFLESKQINSMRQTRSHRTYFVVI